MKLFLMRHGEAELNASSDSQRSLTDTGREDVHQMVLRHQTELSAVNEIWVSPYVRTQQTAEIIVNSLEQPTILITQDFLKPSSDPNIVFKTVGKSGQSLLLVTHQPLIGTMVDRLAGLEPGSHRMGTAALACIEADIIAPACGELCWLHQPTFQ